ncbi:uncharacterized protein B0H18DRAFT_888962 [Fomitopsis serialis]|uniref:uncharacterized protein n=1 Tax=Fomitopsis serialis TaxID=139415 RepID=UPI00200724F5|nr:uncharacterized protein B0H18DRAFT_888962 [Neoantrodia serialis]KAH9913025.1 hypothetical protein B0H18DRAFT_888962 [Neoantrodia serialis]
MPNSGRAFPITEAQLVALFMESVSYGIHVVTFAQCMYTWFTVRHSRGTSKTWPWMFVAVILFAIGTLDVSFNLAHNIMAFVLYSGKGGAEYQFNDMSNWVDVMRHQTARCWIVYKQYDFKKHHWFILFIPILLCLGAIVCAVMDIVVLSTLHESTSIPDATRLRPYLVAYFILTLALNILATGLIVYRIWDIHHQTTAFFKSSLCSTDRIRSAMRIFVESALLYTLSVGVSIIVELAGSNAYYGTSDLSVELAGITFDLIIIRIWRGVTAEQTPHFAQSQGQGRDERRDTQEVHTMERSRAVSPIVVSLHTVRIEDGKDWP